MTPRWRFLLTALAVLALAALVWGQSAKDTYKGLKYDKKTEGKFAGKVDEVMDFDCPVTQTMGNHVALKTLTSRMIVHVAPVKFMKEYGLELNKGDEIEVLGSKLKDANGDETLLAREIIKGNQRIIVRDENGKALW